MIPKRLIYCNFGDMTLRPEVELLCMKTWEKCFPKSEWEWIELNEKTFDVNAFEFTKEAYRKKLYGYVADFARVHELYMRGGVYVDTDELFIEPLAEELYETAFICSSKATFNCKDNTDYLSWGLFGCEKNCEFLRDLLNMFLSVDETLSRRKSHLMRFTKAVMRNHGVSYKDVKTQFVLRTNTIAIYPFDYHTCCFWTTDEVRITYRTKAMQLYAGSWRTNRVKISHFEKRMQNIKKELQKMNKKSLLLE